MRPPMEATDPISTLLRQAQSGLNQLAQGAGLDMASRAELDALRADIERLQTTVAQLEARIEALENRR